MIGSWLLIYCTFVIWLLFLCTMPEFVKTQSSKIRITGSNLTSRSDVCQQSKRPNGLHNEGNRASETGCEAEFLGRCRCGNVTYEGRCRFVTNCTGSGFNDTSVLAQLPIETEVLLFTGNHLGSIPPNMFGVDTNYARLQVIDLSDNGITEIRGQAFHYVPHVRKLVLNRNRWQLGDFSRLFANMQQLEELWLNEALENSGNVSYPMLMTYFNRTVMPSLTSIHLEGNRIGPILEMDQLCAIPHLESVFLANNSVQLISWTTDCFHHLKHMDLSANAIRYLSNSSMEHLEQLEGIRVDLTDNDFVCDCRMTAFYHWLLTSEVYMLNKENYVCRDAYPEDDTGSKIFELSPERSLQCTHLMVLVPSFGAAHAVLIVIILLVMCLLTVVAVANRRIIAVTFSRIGEPIYRRMQYSTISKRVEEQEMDV